MEITLREVFMKLDAYQKAMGYNFWSMTFEERLKVLRNYVLALQVEQAEMLNELPWKPWRKYTEPCNIERVIEEWVDCFVFLIDQALALNIGYGAVESAFNKVMTKNYARISDGTSKINNKGEQV